MQPSKQFDVSIKSGNCESIIKFSVAAASKEEAREAINWLFSRTPLIQITKVDEVCNATEQ